MPAPQAAQSSADPLPIVDTYLPGAQSRQALIFDAPNESENLPATHSEHSVVPASGAYVPRAQGRQLSIALFPTDVVEYLPLGQSVHEGAPSSEYFPAAHHRQALGDADPVLCTCLPAKQLLHLSDPLVSLYLPAAQLVHGPPSGPVVPAMHVQSVISSFRGAVPLSELAGHSKTVQASPVHFP